MNFKVTVVTEKAHAPKLVHEEADARAGGTDHLRKRLLTYFRNDWLRPALLAEIGQQKKRTRQSFFAGIEQLVDKVFLDPNAARQQVRDEQFRKSGLVVQHLND